MPYDVPINPATPVRGSIREGAAINRSIDYVDQGGGGTSNEQPSLGFLVIVGGVVVLRPPFGSPVPPNVQTAINQEGIEPAGNVWINSVRVRPSTPGLVTIAFAQLLDTMIGQSVSLQVVSNNLNETQLVTIVDSNTRMHAMFSKDPGPYGMYYMQGIDGLTFVGGIHPHGYLSDRYIYSDAP